MFDIRRITLFCLEKGSQNTQGLCFLKIWEGMAPLAPLATPMCPPTFYNKIVPMYIGYVKTHWNAN